MKKGVIKIDLQSLISFREKLKNCSIKVAEQEQKTKRAMNVVSQSWRDEKYKKFEAKFMQDAATIKKLIDGLNYYGDLILRKYQEKIQGYKGVKY